MVKRIGFALLAGAIMSSALFLVVHVIVVVNCLIDGLSDEFSSVSVRAGKNAALLGVLAFLSAMFMGKGMRSRN